MEKHRTRIKAREIPGRMWSAGAKQRAGSYAYLHSVPAGLAPFEPAIALCGLQIRRVGSPVKFDRAVWTQVGWVGCQQCLQAAQSADL